MYGSGKPDVTSCFACEKRLGMQYAGGCNACAQSAQPTQCMSCLASYPFK